MMLTDFGLSPLPLLVHEKKVWVWWKIGCGDHTPRRIPGGLVPPVFSRLGYQHGSYRVWLAYDGEGMISVSSRITYSPLIIGLAYTSQEKAEAALDYILF